MIFSQINQVAEAAILTPCDFYDNFSGDQSQWTVISGTWAIEDGMLSQSDTVDLGTNIYASVSQQASLFYEWKVHFISGISAGLHFYSDAGSVYNRGNSYLIWQDGVSVKIYKFTDNAFDWVVSFTAACTEGQTYAYKVSYSPTTGEIEIWRDNLYIGGYTDVSPLQSGSYISLRTNKVHAHFDDVKVSGTISGGIFGTYSVNVREGVTQIIVTCTWSGLGNIAMKLASPVTTYHESDMSMYEKTTVSFNETSASVFNIKRAALSPTMPTSSEIWILYLDLSDVTTYQVTVETS